MIFDCAVIGGGPAGLNASLVLGRSRRKTVLFDDNQPRNAVTSESHGFMTRDGIDPQELKRIAQEELGKYPDVQVEKPRVLDVRKKGALFELKAADGKVFLSKKLILATGFKEVLPDLEKVEEFYGKSLFSCPFCDGWEMRDRPLAVISENENAFHLAKVASNWTDDLIVCTNGKASLSDSERNILESKKIRVYTEKIARLVGNHGALEKIEFESGAAVWRKGGFITPHWVQASNISASLGCKLNALGGIETDGMKRTNIEGVFACGDTLMAGPSQLIMAAADGSMAAICVNAALIEEKFEQ